MSRSISVFGLGYVGTVTATCLAHKGHSVIGVDLNADKVRLMEMGQSSIVEPGVAEMAAECHQGCRLHATQDVEKAVLESEVSFVCVGTPGLRNGRFDLGHLEPVCRDIGQVLRKKPSFHLVVVRSTVLPGTTDTVVVPTLEDASGKRLGKELGICVNPEFMREGTAVEDFLQPPMTVIGTGDPAHAAVLRNLFSWTSSPIFETSFRTAEMVKYACNAWHALKVDFANEMGSLAKQLDVDVEALAKIFTADTKLNLSSTYLKPGFAFGGSCLPKDIRALSYRGKDLDVRLPLLDAILPSNDAHFERAVQMVLDTGKKNVALLGLSFKTATDDLRESPQVQLAKRLLGEGKNLQIWDDNVSLGRLIGSNRQYIEQVIPHIGSLLREHLEDVLNHAEVVVIATRGIDIEALGAKLRPEQMIIDLVNLEKSRRVGSSGSYEGICW